MIGDNVFLGTGSIILKNVTIGDNRVIAAGYVVVKSLPANCIAGGSPAKVIRYYDAYMSKTSALYLVSATCFLIAYMRYYNLMRLHTANGGSHQSIIKIL